MFVHSIWRGGNRFWLVGLACVKDWGMSGDCHCFLWGGFRRCVSERGLKGRVELY